MARHTLAFRAVNKDTFLQIKEGTKKIETRAATEKYRHIQKGDTIMFVCGTKRYTRQVMRAERFSSIRALLKKYKPQDINPRVRNASELYAAYYSFPNYKEKLRRYGLVALRLS